MAMKLQTKVILGLIIGVILMLVWFDVAAGIVKGFFSSKACEESLKSLQLLGKSVDEVIKEDFVKRELLSIEKGCAIIGFSKSKDNFLLAPEKCFGKSCLCICNVGRGAGNEECLKASCLEVDVEVLKGDFKSGEFTEQVLIEEGVKIVEISKEDNSIKMVEKKELDGDFSGDAGGIDKFLESKGSPLVGIGDCVIKTSGRTSVPSNLILAVAIHESGYGKSELAQKGKNLFGIKCGSYSNCEEYGKTKSEPMVFRVYGDFCESINDFADLISGESGVLIYRDAMEHTDNVYEMVKIIGEKGYSPNDPEWSNKVNVFVDILDTEVA